MAGGSGPFAARVAAALDLVAPGPHRLAGALSTNCAPPNATSESGANRSRLLIE